MTELRILTVRQPWAWAIIHGGKDVENRVRNVAGDYRGAIAIHAGLEDDDEAYYDPRIDAALDLGMTPSDSLVRGAIIGVVDLVDVHSVIAATGPTSRPHCETAPEPMEPGLTGACSRWADRYAKHLVFANPRAVDTPIPWRGALHLQKTELFLAGDWIGAPVELRSGHYCTPYGCPPGCDSEPIARLEATS